MISRIWNTYIKLSIRDSSVRLQGLTSVEHYFGDAFTRYQNETSGSHGVGTLI